MQNNRVFGQNFLQKYDKNSYDFGKHYWPKKYIRTIGALFHKNTIDLTYIKYTDNVKNF